MATFIEDLYTDTVDPASLVKKRVHGEREAFTGNIYELWWRALRLMHSMETANWHKYTWTAIGAAATKHNTFDGWYAEVQHHFNAAPFFLTKKITNVEEAAEYLEMLEDGGKVMLFINADYMRPEVMRDIRKHLDNASPYTPKRGKSDKWEMLSEFPIVKKANGWAIKRLLDVYEYDLRTLNRKVLAHKLEQDFGYPMMSKATLSKTVARANKLIANAALGKFPDYTGDYEIQTNGIVVKKLTEEKKAKAAIADLQKTLGAGVPALRSTQK